MQGRGVTMGREMVFWAVVALFSGMAVVAEAFGLPLSLVCAKDVAFASAFAAMLLAGVMPASGPSNAPRRAAAYGAMVVWLVAVAITAAPVLPDSWLDSQATFSRRGPVVEIAWAWIALVVGVVVLRSRGRAAAPVVALALMAMVASAGTARWSDAAARNAGPDDFVGARALVERVVPDAPRGEDWGWVLMAMDHKVWAVREALEGRVVPGVSPLSETPVYYKIARVGEGWHVGVYEGGGALLRRAAPGMFVALWFALTVGIGLAFRWPWLLGHPFGARREDRAPAA